MRIAITGTTGRVGRALADRLSLRHEVIELPRNRLDLAQGDCAERLRALDFDLLINPAGLTGLEACEDDPELARRVNAEAPGALAEACRGRKMLHFSTDYVFDGQRPGLRAEDESPAPLSVYGKTKADGEGAVLGAGGSVMRVSWVFGPERAAFPDQVLARALAGEAVSAVADKYSLPTYTADLAGWVEGWIAAGAPGGIFHGCNGGPEVSWHGIAEEILTFLAGRGIEVPPLIGLELDQMTAFRAPRPRFTAMASRRLERLLGVSPRDWRTALREHLESRLISR